jgi:hypothetical protein
MAGASKLFGGLILITVGLYQWTPLKDACLAQCQVPLVFIQRHGGFRHDACGSLALGIRHGAYCVGCCWVLMALLFVGGVMNVLWIAGLSILILLEKIVPVGGMLARMVGVGFVASGTVLLFNRLSRSPSRASVTSIGYATARWWPSRKEVCEQRRTALDPSDAVQVVARDPLTRIVEPGQETEA